MQKRAIGWAISQRIRIQHKISRLVRQSPRVQKHSNSFRSLIFSFQNFDWIIHVILVVTKEKKTLFFSKNFRFPPKLRLIQMYQGYITPTQKSDWENISNWKSYSSYKLNFRKTLQKTWFLQSFDLKIRFFDANILQFLLICDALSDVLGSGSQL